MSIAAITPDLTPDLTPGRAPGLRARFAQFAGLVRWELRATRTLLLGLGTLVALALIGVIVSVPAHAEAYAAWALFAAVPCAILATQPVVAQTFGASERGGACPAMRAAPVQAVQLVGSRLIAIGMSWCVLYGVALLALILARPFAPEPGPHAMQLQAAFNHDGLGALMLVFAVSSYFVTALVAIATRHGLAAVLGGLLVAAAPWLGFVAAADNGGDGFLNLLGWMHLHTMTMIRPFGAACALVTIGIAFRLRGPAARRTARRVLHVSLSALGLFAFLPVAAWALVAADRPSAFEAEDIVLCDVSVHPLEPRAAFILGDLKGFKPAMRIWTLDGAGGEPRLHTDPTATPFYLSTIQMLLGWVEWDAVDGSLRGQYQLGPNETNYRFFRLDPMTDDVQLTEYDRYREAVAYGWTERRVAPEAPGGERRTCITGTDQGALIEPMFVRPRGMVRYDARSPWIGHYIDTGGTLHRVDLRQHEDRIVDFGTLEGELSMSASPDGRWCLVMQRNGENAALVDTHTNAVAIVGDAWPSWTKREDYPMALRDDGDGESWTLRGLGGDLPLVPDVPCVQLHDLDGQHWIGTTRFSGVVLLDTDGALLRRLR